MMDSILAPEYCRLKNDEFYLFYEMMMQALKTDDVVEGMNKSLFLLRKYLKSGNVAIYKKNKEGIYVFKVSDSQMDDLVHSLGCIINKTKPLYEQNEIFHLDLNLSERLKNITVLHIDIANNNKNEECGVVVLNVDKENELEPQFWERTKDTMHIIMKRAASYERNKKAITTDLLTGLDNRNSYEMRVQAFNEADENLVLGIFDLFRLKYINDNYTHAKGDEYIQATANILSKYWPKQKIIVNDDGTEKTIDTGHCVYRVGGDEFVLLTTKENLSLATIKAGLVAEEENLIDLGIGDDIPIGINSGIVAHQPGDNLKQTFMRADELMQEEKANMYKKYKLERRR